MNEQNIENRYVLDEPFSFGGKYRLYEEFGKNKKALIDKSLRASDIYSRFLQYKKPRRYSPIYVDNKRDLFQCDLIAFTNNELAENNDGYLYLFTTIDVFSKYAWVYKLKNKECKTVMNCFEDILSKCGKRPKRVQTDRGSEFVCKAFKKYFKDQGIHHYVSYSDRKCPVVERFNLTIQQLLYKIMDHNSTNRWIDCIDQAMKIYLNRRHRTITMSPKKAELKKNEKIVRRSLYKYFAKSGLKPQKAKFKIGDTVRVWKYHRKFQRGYDSKFTHEYFKIFKILKNLPVVRYKLKDINGEEILGNYFQEELVPYTEPEFHKTIILDSKGKGRNKMYLVKFEGWDDKYNKWVKEQDTINLDHSNKHNETSYTENTEQNEDGQIQVNDQSPSNSQTNQIEIGQDEEIINSIPINADIFYDNMLGEVEEESTNMHDVPVENQNISNVSTSSSNDRVPKQIMVNVVNDYDVGQILNASEKKADDYQRVKSLRVSTIDDHGVDTMHDIHLKEKGKKRKAPSFKSNIVKHARKSDSSELEKVFKSSRRGT